MYSFKVPAITIFTIWKRFRSPEIYDSKANPSLFSTNSLGKLLKPGKSPPLPVVILGSAARRFFRNNNFNEMTCPYCLQDLGVRPFQLCAAIGSGRMFVSD
jgi:hypothetical protein